MTGRRTSVLLLAYGTPETPDQVEPYFRHIRGGRAPSAEAVESLRRRYELVGGGTPLLDITRRTADALYEALERRAPGEYRVDVAMKHWHPFIAEVVPELASAGVTRIVAIVLAPHYSRMSVGGYRRYLDEALDALADPPEVAFVEQWHLHPAFVGMMAGLVRRGLEYFSPKRDACVLFSAHSLPERIRDWSDPYESQLAASCEAVAERVGLPSWRFAWQSAGSTGEPWLGPDILDYLGTLRSDGFRRVLSVPIGFVCDHLEVLYDIDREAARRAAALGMTLHRTRMPNDSPELIAVLDALVAEAEAARGVGRAAPVR